MHLRQVLIEYGHTGKAVQPWTEGGKSMSKDAKRSAQGGGAFKTFIKGRMSKSGITDPEEVPPGKGAIVQMGHKKVAVYRDDEGKLHARSPICTHLQCIVGWNDTEKTWDCPCHGSRYDPYGHVIEGPAKKGLVEVELEEV
jgi:Rieske Fe-S protein